MAQASRLPTEAPPGFDLETMRQIVAATAVAMKQNGGKFDVEKIIELAAPYLGRRVRPDTVRKYLATREAHNCLQKRGFDTTGLGGLSHEQLYALEIIADYDARSTFQQRLKKAGITNGKLRVWMANPVFARLFNKAFEDTIANGTLNGEAVEGLRKGLERGDTNAVKFALELTGRYNPSQVEAANAQAMLQVVLEVIQEEVKDPAVLQRIATRLAVASGRKAPGIVEGELANEIHKSVTSF